jgi:hypothetical protein
LIKNIYESDYGRFFTSQTWEFVGEVKAETDPYFSGRNRDVFRKENPLEPTLGQNGG